MESRSQRFKNTLATVVYFIKLVHKVLPSYIPVLLAKAFFQAMLPLVMIIGPKVMIDELMGSQDPKRLAIIILAIVSASFVINLLIKITQYHQTYMRFELMIELDSYIGAKTIDIDYECIEDPEILDLKERAIYAAYHQDTLGRMVESLVKVVNGVFSVLSLSVLICLLNPLIIGFLLVFVLINARVFKKIQEVTFNGSQKMIPSNRAYSYFMGLSSDHVIAKDIRLYNMGPLILEKMKGFNQRNFKIFNHMFSTIGKLNGVTNVNIQLQTVLVYAYLVYRVIMETVTIANFTMYVAAISKFSDAMRDTIDSIIDVNTLAKHLELLREYDQLPVSSEKGDTHMEEEVFEIAFENVWFKYPRAKEYTLKNINVVINPGQKVSIIGLNGAGKTTFVKLLTRLYEPTEGRITINGVDIRTIKYSSYIKLVAAVFQDYRLFGMSIQENVASAISSEVQLEQVEYFLNEAGVLKDILKLPKGVKTPLERRFDKKATQLSGGQSQKVAIARALYKNAPIVVLDEPTAALDPIAEHDIYARFNSLVGDKSAIYISHRLSSCRFCDRVLVFDQGEIIQDGHHDQLIEESDMRYHEMFMAQAEHYI